MGIFKKLTTTAILLWTTSFVGCSVIPDLPPEFANNFNPGKWALNPRYTYTMMSYPDYISPNNRANAGNTGPAYSHHVVYNRFTGNKPANSNSGGFLGGLFKKKNNEPAVEKQSYYFRSGGFNNDAALMGLRIGNPHFSYAPVNKVVSPAPYYQQPPRMPTATPPQPLQRLNVSAGSEQMNPTPVRPLMTNAQPVMTNAQPLMTNAQPLMTNAQPVMTNAQPLMTNAQPLMTNAQPVMTNAQPVMTNAQPLMTNAQPVMTNAQPFMTNAHPLMTNAQPLMTNEQPLMTNAQQYNPINILTDNNTERRDSIRNNAQEKSSNANTTSRYNRLRPKLRTPPLNETTTTSTKESVDQEKARSDWMDDAMPWKSEVREQEVLKKQLEEQKKLELPSIQSIFQPSNYFNYMHETVKYNQPPYQPESMDITVGTNLNGERSPVGSDVPDYDNSGLQQYYPSYDQDHSDGTGYYYPTNRRSGYSTQPDYYNVIQTADSKHKFYSDESDLLAMEK